MSAATQKKTKSNVVVLVIGLIISIVASVAINLVVGAYYKDDEFHQALVIANHNISEYTVTLNKDTTDIDGNIHPAGTPFHVFGLYYNLQYEEPRFSLDYKPEDGSGFNPGGFVDFKMEDINPSDDLNKDIVAAKEEATQRHNEQERLKTVHNIKRIVITLIAFGIINLGSYLISRISDAKKRFFMALLFFTVCGLIAICLFLILPYIGHH